MKIQPATQRSDKDSTATPLLKVCGMKHNISAVAALDPDYLGFIFWEGSPRHFDGLIPPLHPRIRKVGVFVNASLDEILDRTATFGLDAIQLHGNESPGFCAGLKKSLRANPNQGGETADHPKKVPQIIKVFTIQDSFDFKVLEPYEAVCDFYLFDTKGKLPGGNGYAFDWSVLKEYPSEKPYFLSGGIGLECMDKLGDFLRSSPSRYCYAIDVNSAFESAPGLKDTDKLLKFKNRFRAGKGL